MSNNNISSAPTSPTIAELYQKIQNGTLVLQPDFQRKFVWTQQHQEEFLDTILKGLPFPEIYVCQGSVNIQTIQTTHHVIDGQQRLTTIKKYIEGNFEKPLRLIKAYSELTNEEKQKFLAYQVSQRDIGKVNEEVVKDIFRRINLTKFKLEDIEVHNAIYDGLFIRTAKDLAQRINLGKYEVFSDSEFTRMADTHFMLQVLSTLIRGGYFNRDTEIEKCIIEFNEEFLLQNELSSKIELCFSIIDELDIKPDSIWFRKSNFFTLVVEICKNIEFIDKNIKSRLDSFEEKIIAAKNSSDANDEINLLREYYSYMYQGTNSRKARVSRSEIFFKYIFANK